MKTKFDGIRTNIMESVKNLFTDYDVLQTGSQELCLPIVGEDNEEGYLVITFKVPKGARDGDPYDGYAMAEEYKMKCKEKARKAEESAKKKAEKVAKDKARREAKKQQTKGE